MTNMTLVIIVGVIVLVVLVFIVVTSITGKKAQKLEQERRKKVVRDEIKNYIALNENKKNLRIEYENVIARKGGDYKYRDVFDVVVSIYEPKTNKLVDTRSYEIEGITEKIDKKNYKTSWQVNKRTDLEETKRAIAIATKEIVLSKEEKKALKIQEKKQALEDRKKEREEIRQIKELKKSKSVKEIDAEKQKQFEELMDKTAVKFIPKREK